MEEKKRLFLCLNLGPKILNFNLGNPKAFSSQNLSDRVLLEKLPHLLGQLKAC